MLLYSKHINNNLLIKKLENIKKKYLYWFYQRKHNQEISSQIIEIWLAESTSFYIEGGSEKLT